MNPELERIAKKEGVRKEKLEKRTMEGSVVIVKNANREIEPLVIGSGLRTRVNANIGVSPTASTMEDEIKKADVAIEAGADALMDLSITKSSRIDRIRRKIIRHTSIPLGTVPIYQAIAENSIHDVTLETILKVIETQCRDGVDFMTIHSGITKNIVDGLKGGRVIPITSRGGCLIAAWMTKNNEENPLYAHFDEVLEILREYEVVISLGDALRPGSIVDASDSPQIQELMNLGRLNRAAKKAGVQCIIEGPGHVPLDQIAMNVRLQKTMCDNAPFYVLGPLVTDIALGHDHIAGAVGGAIAALHGADFLCYVTPREHLGLPDADDVREGVIASRIAAHAADIIKLGNKEKDLEMSEARRDLDWHRMFESAIDKEVKKKYSYLIDQEPCTMCGEYCALRIVKELFQ